MRTRGSVSADLLHLAVRHAEASGVDPVPVLAATGVDASRGDAEGRVDAAAFSAVVDGLARASGDPCFGLHLGASPLALQASRLVAAIVENSPTVGEGLERLLRYHAILADAVTPSTARVGAELRVRPGGAAPPPLGVHVADAAVATIASVVRRLSGGGALASVRLRHGAPAGAAAAEYERVLGAPVRFGAPADELRIFASALARPLFLADRELLATLERHAAGRLASLERSGVAGRAGRAVRAALLADGAPPALAVVARALGASPRTLQAHLAADGTTFRDVVAGARRALAEELLADPGTALAEIAFVLGFADQSAFTHAFRRWTGTTPGAFRGRRR